MALLAAACVVGAGLAAADVTDDVAAAVAFWESRKPSAMRTQKVADGDPGPLTTGQVSDPLLARVTASWEGHGSVAACTRPGRRFTGR
ncbi:MAG: hypothetical protein OXI08_02665 [Cyanobacteria bacterium MAG IRC4_bin_6]|nr:hypothetical protein [Cyanobacteria bacterium MAG IRC3_bin_20]MDE0646961.1 hypothetical protein [Cyanobacteria bacterium MAG IRC4_bin_6]